MKCPRCGFENQEDVRYCSQCGLARQATNLNMQKEPLKNEKPLDYNMPMKFHTFYSVMLIIVAVLTLLTSIVGLFFEDYVILSCLRFLPAIAWIVTGILLLSRNKAGRILLLILNILEIAKHVYVFAMSLLAGVLFFVILFLIATTGELETIIALALIFGFCILLMMAMAIGNIVVNGLIIRYYSKRSHMFK